MPAIVGQALLGAPEARRRRPLAACSRRSLSEAPSLFSVSAFGVSISGRASFRRFPLFDVRCSAFGVCLGPSLFRLPGRSVLLFYGPVCSIVKRERQQRIP